jgi:hypothetical protein
MKRSDFLKKIATTMGVVTIAPTILMAKNEPVEKGKTSIAIDMKAISHLTLSGKKLTALEVIRLWKETGILIYNSEHGNCPNLFNGTIELIDMNG